MTKQCILATILEVCQTKNHKNEYENGNERKNGNGKVIRGQTKRMKKRTKLMKPPTIALNFTHLKEMMSCKQRSVSGGNAVSVACRSIK